ncbi:MAG: hypothetical protein PSN04_01220 [Methyloprofundus sp.]|nr:hypothetical protein [Methyloprofundus sp.]
MQEQFITDKTGQKVSVILPIQEYEDLLEDVKGLAAVVGRVSLLNEVK